jgi:LysR family transcriptional regulator, transcriptional activator of nhaA
MEDFEKSEETKWRVGYLPGVMEWLNFHHLRYFYAVARDGSIAKASQALHVSQPSISTQLRLLERALGEKLLSRQGRGLVLTDMGRLVYGYAEQIFGLGRELLDTVRDRPTGLPLRVQVGIADVVPKGLAFRLLQPLVTGPEPARLVVREDRPDRLLAELAVYQLDLVIADMPAAAGSRVRAFSHALGASQFAVFGTEPVARRLRRKFPSSLQDQPFVLPLDDSQLRREFEAWMRGADLRVDVRGEVEDSALATTFAAAGVGLMLAPAVLAPDLRRRGLVSLGVLPDLRCRYYAITVERRVKNPAVARLLDAARGNLFA